jgi:hypothetical protein
MPLVDINARCDTPLGHGVTEAWVVHRRAPPPGREDAAVTDPRMRRYFAATPAAVDDLERGIADHRAGGGLAVVRIFPGGEGDGYPLAPWAVSPIPEYCAREELALVVDYRPARGEFPWREIVDFARAYPRLAVVALAAPLGGPTAGRALAATANLILDTSALAAGDIAVLAGLAASRGAWRLAYAGGPASLPAAAIAAGVDRADADLILAGTAGHLAAGTWSSSFL